jgi:hypothetical protein
MVEQDDIRVLYEEAISWYTKEEQSNFHLNSVGNFIQHMDELPYYSIKSEVRNRIKDYLLFLKENRTNYNLNSLELFEEYVHPVGTIYTNYLQFGIKSKVWIVGIWMVIINLLAYIIFNNNYINAAVTAFILTYYVKFLIKEKQNKVYCYKY